MTVASITQQLLVCFFINYFYDFTLNNEHITEDNEIIKSIVYSENYALID